MMKLWLQGVIDANVMGGIAKYQAAFLSESFLQDNPHYVCDTALLARLLHQQVGAHCHPPISS